MKNWRDYREGDVTNHGHLIEIPPVRGRFDGDDYDPVMDFARLSSQIVLVYLAIRSQPNYLTIEELADRSDQPASSVTSQLRNMRKNLGGNFTVDRQVRGERRNGLYEFWVGGRGTHTPVKPAVLLRAEAAEEWAAELASELETHDPTNPSLVNYYELYGRML